MTLIIKRLSEGHCIDRQGPIVRSSGLAEDGRVADGWSCTQF